MASKCKKCGNTDEYNFELNIGLCNICIGEKLERIDELEIAKTIGIQACDLLRERIEELKAENIKLREILAREIDDGCAEVDDIGVEAWIEQALKGCK